MNNLSISSYLYRQGIMVHRCTKEKKEKNEAKKIGGEYDT